MKESHWVLRAVILRLILEPSGLGGGGGGQISQVSRKAAKSVLAKWLCPWFLKLGNFTVSD